MLFTLQLLATLALWIAATGAQEGNPHDGPSGFAHFKTEPHLEPASFSVNRRVDDYSMLAPGYFFLSMAVFKPKPISWGPQIFADDGTLLFYNPPNSTFGTQEPHVCDFKGEKGTHICSSIVDGVVQGIWETRKGIYNNHYELVQEAYGAVGDFPPPDGHEFSMVDEGRAYLQPLFKKTEVNLTPFGGGPSGIILDACFQEISVETGMETFSWCYMDHHSMSNTYIYLDVPGNTVNITSHMAGWGNESRPWDAFHPNAMDKNSEGDYLLSVRHTNEILKIAGRREDVQGVAPGHAIWRLGGKYSDFELQGFTFGRQHHARFVEETSDYTILSFFDNSWEGDNDPQNEYSSGKLVRLDHKTMKAELLQEYKHPDALSCMAAGSMQNLPNGNKLVGWGWKPYVTEFDAEGNVLYDANFTQVEGGFSYRTRKYAWVGRPRWPAKLLAYSQTCSSKQSPLVAYVSWNGATEVKSWSFSVSVTGEKGPWIPAGKYPKTGFETEVKLLQGKILKRLPLVRWVYVVALDAQGRTIGEARSQTFVPAEEYRGHACSDMSCAHRYEYPEEDNVVGTCSTSTVVYMIPALIALAMVIFALEFSASILVRLLDQWSGGPTREIYLMNGKGHV